MAAYKLAIFDWDGTLMDSVAHIVDSMQQAAYVLGEPVPSVSAVRHIIGLGLPEAIALLFPKPVRWQEKRFASNTRNILLHIVRLKVSYLQAQSLCLAQLTQQGYLLAIATGKSRLGLDRVLAQTGIGHYFVATRCADETASKPHPLMLQAITGLYARARPKTVL
jgi:phosphoglycolate phosphatase